MPERSYSELDVNVGVLGIAEHDQSGKRQSKQSKSFIIDLNVDDQDTPDVAVTFRAVSASNHVDQLATRQIKPQNGLYDNTVIVAAPNVGSELLLSSSPAVAAATNGLQNVIIPSNTYTVVDHSNTDIERIPSPLPYMDNLTIITNIIGPRYKLRKLQPPVLRSIRGETFRVTHVIGRYCMVDDKATVEATANAQMGTIAALLTHHGTIPARLIMRVPPSMLKVRSEYPGRRWLNAHMYAIQVQDGEAQIIQSQPTRVKGHKNTVTFADGGKDEVTYESDEEVYYRAISASETGLESSDEDGFETIGY